ncbi:MAG: 2,3-bisphosphoglycerate-independent phosphoglycerate mutase, partial [Thermodesulfobacteriota bacterium]
MRPLVLIVLDGWGINPKKDANATALADTPNISRLLKTYPSTKLNTSGLSVGLPDGQMGNSEVGHLTLGSGRVIFQDLTRINKSVQDGSFFENPTLNSTLTDIKERGATLHLMLLLSDGGVHSHILHLYALLGMAWERGLSRVYVHAFLDGRDTPPKSGTAYIKALLSHMGELGVGRVATVSGRYYAMDRDERWDRVKKAYDAMVHGDGVKAEDPLEALRKAYERGETDEFVHPTVITDNGKPTAVLSDGDGVIFLNFRADRARELTLALTQEEFTGFDRKKKPDLGSFTCMTEY